MPTLSQYTEWIDGAAAVFASQKQYLTDLDAAIGDADHGNNIARGFAAADQALIDKPPATMADAAKTVAMTLIKTVGGASGPLFGTLFMKMAPQLGSGDAADLPTFVAALKAGVEGVKTLGKSTTGEKTMLDALVPAVEALDKAASDGTDEPVAFAAAAEAAEAGAQATVPMQATKGRASYLGERSVGHQDPGATSVAFLLGALAKAVE